jgi:hypothetical protein
MFIAAKPSPPSTAAMPMIPLGGRALLEKLTVSRSKSMSAATGAVLRVSGSGGVDAKPACGGKDGFWAAPWKTKGAACAGAGGIICAGAT